MEDDLIGKPERRVDALGKVTGTARFAEDYTAAHQLFGKVLRSKFPHARIVRIDTHRAEELEGVEAVLIANDIPGCKTFGIVVKNQAIVASDKVRYLGDGVVLVAARNAAIATHALSLIDIEYEPLPVVTSPEEGMHRDAPKIHDEGNVFVHHVVRKGDVERLCRGRYRARTNIPYTVCGACVYRTRSGSGGTR